MPHCPRTASATRPTPGATSAGHHVPAEEGPAIGPLEPRTHTTCEKCYLVNYAPCLTRGAGPLLNGGRRPTGAAGGRPFLTGGALRRRDRGRGRRVHRACRRASSPCPSGPTGRTCRTGSSVTAASACTSCSSWALPRPCCQCPSCWPGVGQEPPGCCCCWRCPVGDLRPVPRHRRDERGAAPRAPPAQAWLGGARPGEATRRPTGPPAPTIARGWDRNRALPTRRKTPPLLPPPPSAVRPPVLRQNPGSRGREAPRRRRP
jgi:hypothetical protein